MSEEINIPSSTSTAKGSITPAAVETEALANSILSGVPSNHSTSSYGSATSPFGNNFNNNAFGFESSVGSGSSNTSMSSLNNPIFSQCVASSTPQSQSSFTGNSSHYLGKPTAVDAKRKPSLQVVVPKSSSNSQVQNGSSDSLNKSPHSPGSIVGEESTLEEKDKELSYKDQRKNYRKEKQRVAQELSTALKNPTVTILSGAIKVRGKLKSWTKLWGVLKPGLLLLYKSNKIKSSHWVATVLLHCCKVIERPSKKEGFCFKVFHPLEQSIWATKGPDGETMGAVVQPLPATYLICRAPSADDGKCWMDGLEVALSNQPILLTAPKSGEIYAMEEQVHQETNENESEWCHSDEEEKNRTPSEKSDSDISHVDADEQPDDEIISHDTEDEGETPGEPASRRTSRTKSKAESLPTQTNYVANTEDFAHDLGEQTEVLADENKSLLWFLLKQVRPGMDLSRVVLPTFILEPRSFLDKLSDYYYHADLLSKAVLADDPFTRITCIVRWYLSGFYKKPKGLKKPYNPVLGETFRCKWKHPNDSTTFYIAEQVSHHPPVSAFYVSNKKDGFAISAAILAKSKFYGNSTSAILEGQARLMLLPRGEIYYITMPYAHCKGILLGTLSMELGGNVTIVCEKTGYQAEMEFKLKSFLSRSDNINAISGKIKLGRETLANFEGHWDNKITMKDKRSPTQEETVLWEVTDTVRAERLTRYTVPFADQYPTESEKLWIKVSEAIGAEDQIAATVEKTKLEEQQRLDVKERLANNTDWIPKYFIHNGDTWCYKNEDFRPWDDGNDVMEYENDYAISTLQRHRTTTAKMTDLLPSETKCDIMRDAPSDQIVPAFHQRESNRQLIDLLRQLLARQIEQSEQIEQLKTTVTSIQARLARPKPPSDPFPITNTILAVIFAVALQILLVTYWFGDGKLIPDIKRPK